MNIWIVKIGEPLSTDREGIRLLRAGLIAEALVKKGHYVTWWTSAFDHQQKCQRFSCDKEIQVGENYSIKMLKSLGYKKTISFRRMLDHQLLAQRFSRRIKTEKTPDLIICAVPTIELGCIAVRYGLEKKVPVVLDLRDMWPDIFLDVIPPSLKSLARFVLKPKFKAMQFICQNATALFGVTEKYLEWGLSYARRSRIGLDRVFPLTCSGNKPSEKMLSVAERFWTKFPKLTDSQNLILTYVGSFTQGFDIKPIIEVVKQNNLPIALVLAGEGPTLEECKRLAAGSQQIIFPGWLDHAQIWSLLRLSSIGLAPYKNITNFQSNITNKYIEYFSAGLPVFSSLSGVTEELLLENNCGFVYNSKDLAEIKELLSSIVDNKENLKMMSNNALRLYNEKFDAKVVYPNMVKHIEDIVVTQHH